MKNYTRLNNLIGWLVCIAACTVYVMTAERTTSWWDCGEYISTAFKLQVGHPPGAPTFQLLGNLFSMLAFGDIMKVGFMINVMSALCSGFTILFLFWSITMLAKKLALKNGELTTGKMWMIFGSGLVGAMAYTFSDSFWFSAVEGEVYAMSSFFTAISFWAILKWETVADQPHHLRWIIFISFMIGLAIGVHLLNLLVIPAVVFVIYYKKFPQTRKGFWYALGISGFLLGLILWVIIPYIVNLAGQFDLFFVNSLGMPFNSGTYFYFALLVGGIVWGLLYAIKKKRVILHTSLLCLVFLLIGYSTFFIIIIRANAGVPINENEPKNAYSLLDYLNREQYGTRPLVHGQFFTARITAVDEGSPKYARDTATGRYKKVGYTSDVTYDPAHCGLLPRMHSNDAERGHVQYYKIWSGASGDQKPTMGENMRFMFRYQMGWMYWRYFMWNFVGRQNDQQGLGYDGAGNRDVLNGNWLSGIDMIDEARLGPQDNLPDFQKNNQSRNVYYFLPLILGLIGLWYHYKKDKKDSFIVFLLFFMTGLAIILYVNQPSTEPRERDYSVVGSFYAFAIWIGLGVMAIADLLSKKMNAKLAAALTTAVTFTAVPVLMAAQNWDDHDRSHKTSARDFARNTLESCEPNAILVTNGDNDTFPVWFCQEVENIRTDVRVINSALAGSYWHIEPLFKMVYKSAPLKFTLAKSDYGQGTNDHVYINDRGVGRTDLETLMKFVASTNSSTKLRARDGNAVSYLPTAQYRLPIDRDQLLSKGIITADEYSRTPTELTHDINAKEAITRSDLALLDILASNQWERPIYVASPHVQRNIWPISTYAQMEGNCHRFVPYINRFKGLIATGENGILVDKTYDLFVNKFTWGNLHTDKAHIDPESFRSAVNARIQYVFLAQALTVDGKNDSAVKALDKALEFFPHHKIGFDRNMVYFVQAYFAAGAIEKGTALANQLLDIYEHNLRYYERFPSKHRRLLEEPIRESVSVFYSLRHQFLRGFEGECPELVTRLDSLLEGRV